MSDTGNIEDFKVDSLNLKKIDGKSFTIVEWKRSDYTDNKGEIQAGIKFTILEEFEGFKKLHTTRQIIVRKFYNIKKDGTVVSTELGNNVKNGTQYSVKCELQKAKKGGNDYFDFVKGDKV